MTVSVDLRLDFIHAGYARRAGGDGYFSTGRQVLERRWPGRYYREWCCRIADANLDLWE